MVKAFLKSHKSGSGYKRIFYDDGIEHEGKSMKTGSWTKTFLDFTTGKKAFKWFMSQGASKHLNVS